MLDGAELLFVYVADTAECQTPYRSVSCKVHLGVAISDFSYDNTSAAGMVTRFIYTYPSSGLC